MMMCTSMVGRVLMLVGFLVVAQGFQSYQGIIPNGGSVNFDGRAWDALGHNTRTSGGELNPFGEAFLAAGRQWSGDLCKADSDKDGQSNGEELGDPDCVWTPGATAARTTDITHPGFAEGVDLPAAKGGGRNGAGVIIVVVLALVLSALGASIARWELPVKVARALFWPRPNGWNLSNVLGVTSMKASLVGLSIGLCVGASAYEQMMALGLAAGLASPLPILWAFMRPGAHTLFAMSREAAWRLHISLGIFALFFGFLHGIVALAVAPGSAVTSEATGFFGLLLMVVGVIPAVARILVPNRITYDKWKLMHFLSLLGYLLTLAHLFGHAMKGTTEAVLVAIINIGASIAYFVQLFYVRFRSSTAEIVDSAIVDHHVCLRMHAPGFKYAPGQWARLSIPSISLVAHPFTVVPDSADQNDHLQLIVKVSGEFTRRLAEASLKSTRVSLQGPYGRPPLAPSNVQGAVFIVGGVGVTPALSLVREASRSCAGNVRLYWNMRSMELLQRCAPLLEPHLTPGQQCIRLTDRATLPSLLSCRPDLGKVARPNCEPNALPLGAVRGKEALEPWLAAVADSFYRQNVCSVLLFVCGPSGLVQAVQQAAKKDAPVDWLLHIERFEFLPAPARGIKAVSAEGEGARTEGNALGYSLQQRDTDHMEVVSFEGDAPGLAAAAAAEGDRASCRGLDWKSKHGDALAANANVDDGMSGMDTWFAWRTRRQEHDRSGVAV
jgi:predicted ferric reductase